MSVLCKAKANAYIKNRGGFAPLHLCCQNGHNETCRVLLLAGCKPDIKNNVSELLFPVKLLKTLSYKLILAIDIVIILDLIVLFYVSMATLRYIQVQDMDMPGLFEYSLVPNVTHQSKIRYFILICKYYNVIL